MYLEFVFVIFWQNKIGEKAAPKMLVTLTSGVSFTYILRAAFLYTSVFQSVDMLTVWQKEIGAKAPHKV